MFGLEKRVQDGLIRVENIVDKKERGLRDLIEKNKVKARMGTFIKDGIEF